MHKTSQLLTDALGFPLKVVVSVGDFPNLGQHRTHQDAESGQVSPDAVHYLNFKAGLESSVLNVVIPHEVYHLFYSVRHLITVDEETESEAFGELVGRVHNEANQSILG
jgi:hypothetical protein